MAGVEHLVRSAALNSVRFGDAELAHSPCWAKNQMQMHKIESAFIGVLLGDKPKIKNQTVTFDGNLLQTVAEVMQGI